MKPESRDSKKVGGTIDSWCGKCRHILAHTIEAMVGEKPARVHCNTCKAQHAYRPQQPAASSRAAKLRTSGHATLLKGKDTSRAKPYSFTEQYAPGDVIHHATFGFGVAKAVKGNKVEVLFDRGTKVLIHDR